MGVLILSFSANKVNEDSYILNKKELTFACVDSSFQLLVHVEEEMVQKIHYKHLIH